MFTINQFYQHIILILLLSLLGFSGQGYAQKNKKARKADNLTKLLKTALNDRERVDVLLALINTYIIKHPEKAYKQCKEVLALSQKINYLRGIAYSYDRLGIYYKHAHEYEKGLDYHLKGLKIFEQIGDKERIAASLGNIGVIHKNLENYPKAFEYQLKALDLMKKLGKEGMIANTLSNIGLLYLRTKKYKKSINYFERTLVLDQKTNYAQGLGDDYSNISFAWYNLKNYDKALEFEEKALAIREKINHSQGKTISYRNIGNIYKETGDYAKAIDYLDRALKLAQKIKAKLHISRAYRGLAAVYEAQHNYKKALEFQKKFKVYNDSIFNLDKNKQVAKMQTLYDTEKKEQENKLLRQETQRQFLINIFISIALFITLGFIYMGYKHYSQKKKSYQQLQQLNNEVKSQNEALKQKQEEILQQQETLSLQNGAITEQKEEISLQAEELQVTNEQLVALDKFKQNMTGMIVHDLKNPLNTIIGLSGDEYTSHFQSAINQSGKQMLNLVMNILDVQRFEETEVQVKAKSYALKKLIETAHERVSLLLADKSILFRQDVPEDVYLQVDESLIVRVFVNLLSNAIKYTPNEGKVTVTLDDASADDPYYQKILINDTGIGIPAEFTTAIFDRFSQHNPKARSTGLGLTFCKLAVESHQGKIGVRSEVDKGSTFWITLPKVPDNQKGVLINENSLELADQSEKSFEFSPGEEDILKPVIEQLRQHEIYEVSAIKKVLDTLSAPGEAIEEWRTQLENTLYSWNEAKYQQLLSLFDPQTSNQS